MDEPLWELFWTTGLPEAYALAKQAGEDGGTDGVTAGGPRPSPTDAIENCV